MVNEEKAEDSRRQPDDDAFADDESFVDEVAATEDAEIDGERTPEEKIAALEAKAAEYLEGWQRARAEFANARKRLERERGEARRNATIDVAAKLLPVLDDFERALESVPPNIADVSWYEGIALIYRKLTSILDNVNIERIEAVGQPFDPNLHEAVLQEESGEYESGVVMRELQTGYRLNDRVIRPSMVVVAA